VLGVVLQKGDNGAADRPAGDHGVASIGELAQRGSFIGVSSGRGRPAISAGIA
jgi:hypothetical protein